MNKKSKWLKPRVWIPLLVLLLFYTGCGVYLSLAGRTNSVSIGVGKTSYAAGSLEGKSSDENVMKITQIKEEKPDDTSCILTIEVERTGSGEATLTHSFDMVDSPGDPASVSTITSNFQFVVLPLGILYNKTDRHFNGIETLLVLTIGTMVIVAAALVFSVLEKYRLGDFSYTMVVRCGLIIFFAVYAVIIAHKWTELIGDDRLYDIIYIVEVLFNGAKTFVMLSTLPLSVLALALALSNVQLVRHEGFRPMNLLGFFLGVVMMGGIVALYWLNNHLVYDSLTTYFVSIFVTIAFAFVYSYFECMLLSTILCAILSTRYKPPYDLDYIIILGCAIRSDGTPTPLLKGRAERALSFEREQFALTGKHAKFVPSGGQGSDESISEAASMKRWLTEQGVPAEQIVEENRSVNTYQNMAFSKQVIEADAGQTEGVQIGFSTTNYHVFRGYTLANRVKMKVRGLSAKTKLYFFPNAFIREFIGLLWEQKLRHLLCIVLLLAALGCVYFMTTIYG